MIPIPENALILLHGDFVDLRNGFDGLAFCAYNAFKKHLLSEVYVVFLNRRRTRMKVLLCNGNLLTIWYVRSLKHTFSPPRKIANTPISRNELEMILKGKMPEYLFQS